MRFKDFMQLTEVGGPMGGGAGGTDNGLMGYPVSSSVKKPSDGQPFKNLGSVAGQTPRANTGGTGGGMSPMGGMFMKKMKRR